MKDIYAGEVTRDELYDMIDWLDSQTSNAAARTANFLRQIAYTKPEHWAVELRLEAVRLIRDGRRRGRI